MIQYKPEKRHYPRVIFRDPKQIAALVSSFDAQEPEKSLFMSILNMGEGGLQVSVERILLQGIKQGQQILLKRINGLPELETLADIPMQVIWVMDNEYLDHILIGTCFDTLPDEQIHLLRSFIETCLQRKCSGSPSGCSTD